MALNTVTLTGTVPGGAGATAAFTPSAWLTDATDNQLIPPVQKSVILDRNGKFSVSLLATDNAAPLPSGWTWSVVISGINVASLGFSFFLPFSGGATQDIADLAPVQPTPSMAAYMPLPSGTPTAGQIPVATGIGEASAWAAQNRYLIFGNGSDGVATLDGVATVPWASLVGSIYTVTRDAYLASLTINNGVTLVPAGNRVQVAGPVINNGTISGVGNNASGATGGLGTSGGIISGGRAGGNGATGTGAVGSSGFLASAAGGAGGAGSSGAGGAGGTVTSSFTRPLMTPFSPLAGVGTMFGSNQAWQGGPGGGGGGGDGTNAGGGGGGGGACIFIFAWSFTNNGAITVNGGNGGNGTGGNAGGGGAGSGGIFALYTLTPWTNNGTATATPGTPGSKTGTGSNGGNAGAGTILNVVLS